MLRRMLNGGLTLLKRKVIPSFFILSCYCPNIGVRPSGAATFEHVFSHEFLQNLRVPKS
jgi:hypothetical protein